MSQPYLDTVYTNRTNTIKRLTSCLHDQCESVVIWNFLFDDIMLEYKSQKGYHMLHADLKKHTLSDMFPSLSSCHILSFRKGNAIMSLSF